MIRLLQIEMLKVRHYRAFWILLAFYVLFMVLAMVGFNGMVNSMNIGGPNSDMVDAATGMQFKPRVNQFPEIWQYLTYIAGWFHYILAVVLIILVTNEYSYKTIRQGIINGSSRGEFLMGKVLLAIVLALMATAIIFLTIMVIGLVSTEGLRVDRMFRKVAFLPAFFIQCVGFLMLALFISLLVKRAGFAIGILLLYGLVADKIAAYYIPEPLHLYLPIEAMDNLIQLPIMQFIGQEVSPLPTLRESLLTLGYSVVFGLGSLGLVLRRDT